MTRTLIVLIVAVIALSGCSLQKDWVEQNRDTFFELDDAGLDQMVADATWLSEGRKNALHNLNRARRARIKRDCVLVGIPEVPPPVPK